MRYFALEKGSFLCHLLQQSRHIGIPFGYHLPSCVVFLRRRRRRHTLSSHFSQKTTYCIIAIRYLVFSFSYANSYLCDANPTSCLPTQVIYLAFMVLSENFCHTFLRNYLSQPLDIWYATLAIGPILCLGCDVRPLRPFFLAFTLCIWPLMRIFVTLFS